MRKFSHIITLNVRKSICENKKITVQNREKEIFAKKKALAFANASSVVTRTGIEPMLQP